jgi:hypothetical protein
MFSLLQKINESANESEAEADLISRNIFRLMETSEGIELEQINETITSYLNTAARAAEGGKLDDSQKENVASVFAAVAALINPDLADAFDERNDLGAILYKADASGDEAGNAALNRLREIGNHPSAKTFKRQAIEAINDPTRVKRMADKLRIKIEPIMNKKVSAMRQGAEQAKQRPDMDKMARPMQGAVPRASQ